MQFARYDVRMTTKPRDMPLPVRMPRPQIDRLAEIAAELGMTRTEYVRGIIGKAVREHERSKVYN